MTHPPQRRERLTPLNHAPAAVTYARETAGMTKRALAEACEVSEQLMCDIEAGRRSATPATLRRIAQVLGCPYSDLQTPRPHCQCAVVQNYDYDTAAQKLGCKPRFLKDRINRIPHQKFGESVAFCDCELALIQAMFTVAPASIDAWVSAPVSGQDTPPDVPAIRQIRPSKGRKTAAS
ncbi:helix-turn-helix transcriptional regulator [Streptomyces diacarni]|uniref:helix-turn-helix transcriptional regulator n=1 Tax=Streptomyces diacarni TaxID=2800381 RepID=UPI0033F18EE8